MLYINTVLGVDAMEDDLIDDSGFELGMPSQIELLKHQCDLLYSELETTRMDLRRAHQTITGLIVMYRDSSKELATLKIEHERLRWTLSDMYRRESESESALGKMTYAYGDYTNPSKKL